MFTNRVDEFYESKPMNHSRHDYKDIIKHMCYYVLHISNRVHINGLYVCGKMTKGYRKAMKKQWNKLISEYLGLNIVII